MWEEFPMAKNGESKIISKGRFTFAASGEFSAPYAYENLLKLIALGAGVGFVALVTFVAVKVLGNTISTLPGEGTVESKGSFPAIVAGFVIFVSVILAIFVVGFLIRYISTGFKCTYAANDEKMVLNYGKTEYVIFYGDVDLVNFSPRSFLWKIRGYDVQIRINGKIEQFSITSDAYITPKSTPFFIIKEQSERAHIENVDKDDENRTEREIALNIVSGRAISKEEIERARNKKASVYDRLSDLLGEDAESVSNEPPHEYVSPLEGKVSPTTDGYSGDLPRTTEMFEREQHEIVLNDGRERDLYAITKTGSFYVTPTVQGRVISQILWLILGLAAGFFPAYIVLYYVGNYVPTAGMILFCSIDIGVGIWFFIHGLKHQRGQQYHYRADGRSMKITSNRNPEENIIFDNVKSVNYIQKKLFGRPYSIQTSIVTRYGTLEYRYMYPRYGRELKESELPFEIIKDNIREE